MKHRFTPIVAAALIAAAALAYAQPPQNAPAGEDYVLVFLKSDPNPPQIDKEAGDKLQEAHMANIRRLHSEGKLVAAGPFLESSELRGIFVLKTKSLDEAKQWTETDPAIQQHRLAAEYHAWPQPAGTFSSPPADNPMENYVMVLYRRGPKFQPVSPAVMPLIQRHLSYIRGLLRDGKIVAAGPFRDPPGANDLVGIYFVIGKDKDAAQQIVAQDPFVMEGEVTAELHPWITQKGVLAH
jgi:uncharacterized protein YciI